MKNRVYQIIFWLWVIGIASLIIMALIANTFR